MYVPKGLCLCSLWTTLWMIILLHDYYSSAHHGTSTQTQTERLDSSVLHYGFIISTVSCLEMCSKHRSSSITVKSWDVKQFIYQRFYWWLKNGVCWWLLFSFKYVNGFLFMISGSNRLTRVWSESLKSSVVPLVPWHITISSSPQSNKSSLSVMKES